MQNLATEQVVRLRNVRRNLTAVLLNLPINTRETTVAALLGMLDHFSEHPNEYIELKHDKNQKTSRL